MSTEIALPPEWITGHLFEQALGLGPGPLRSTDDAVSFTVPAAGKLMVDASVRLLSLANQLSYIGKRVGISFSASDSVTVGYLSRIGFFDGLDAKVHVSPSRPRESLARRYRGHNAGVVEIARIQPGASDDDLPRRLSNSVLAAMKTNDRRDRLASMVYTLFGELMDNVYEHSGTPLDGFAVLQVYPKGNCVRIAVSDSGKGLIDTLRPSLAAHYPRLINHSDTQLLVEVFRQGLSRHGRGHGAGLQRCASRAVEFGANLDVRLPISYVRIRAKAGAYQYARAQVYDNCPLIWGTHIAFDIRLD